MDLLRDHALNPKCMLCKLHLFLASHTMCKVRFILLTVACQCRSAQGQLTLTPCPPLPALVHISGILFMNMLTTLCLLYFAFIQNNAQLNEM